MSKSIRPGKPAASGFTLIELLVVIVIIGIMVSLMVAALLGARERGRQTVCMNNQEQLGKAILGYESSAGHFPGFVNAVPGYQYGSTTGGTTAANLALNWCELLLPYIDRPDIWAGDGQWPQTMGAVLGVTGSGMTGFRCGSFSPAKISLLTCPDDGNANNPLVAAPLSFMVNSNVCNNRLMSLTGGVVDVTVSQLQRSSRTLLLGEGPSSTTMSASTALTTLPQPPPLSAPNPRQWNWTDSEDPSQPYQFYAAYAPDPSTNLPKCFPPLNMTFTWAQGVMPAQPLPPGWHLSSLTQLFPTPPNHGSVYVVTYCDGHVEALSTDADCSTISTRVDGGIP